MENFFARSSLAVLPDDFLAAAKKVAEGIAKPVDKYLMEGDATDLLEGPRDVSNVAQQLREADPSLCRDRPNDNSNGGLDAYRQERDALLRYTKAFLKE